MKGYNIIESIRLFVMKAQTQKALEELYHFLTETKVPDVLNQLIILSSNYNDIERSENLGLGKYVEEKNRINLAILTILSELENDQRIKIKPDDPKEQKNERLELLESKIDFLLNYIEKNDDILFYGFNNSQLWKGLEKESQEKLMQANIIEKEAKQDNYKYAMYLLIEAVERELECKFFNKFKEKYDKTAYKRSEFMDAFAGQNKQNLYNYLHKDGALTLKQSAEILLQNILLMDKEALTPLSKSFYYTFHDCYKIKNPEKVVEFCKKYIEFDVKRNVNFFTQTLIDVAEVKEDVINLFLNLQPGNSKA